MELEGGCAKTALSGELKCCFPLSTATIPCHRLGPGLGARLFAGVKEREGGVVSSCLPHFLPSTPALIGNLGGPVYLHG